MSYLALCLSLILTPAAWACMSLPQNITLSGSSFSSLPLSLSSNGTIESEGDRIHFNLQKKTWCLKPADNQAQEVCNLAQQSGTLHLTDPKTKRPAAVVIVNDKDRSLLFMSIDKAGKIDRSKPYLRFKNNTDFDSSSHVFTNMSVEALDKGKVVGSMSTGGLFKMQPNGQLTSATRGLSKPGTPGDMIDLKGKSVSASSCGSAKIENFAAGGKAPRGSTFEGESSGTR